MEICNHYCPGCATGDCPLKDEIKELKETVGRLFKVLDQCDITAADGVVGE